MFRLHLCGEAPIPILLAQPQRLSFLPPELLTICEEVWGRAEGPRGQVPGQLLQLAQQAFHFCLQELHRLLHRLEQGERGTGWGAGQEDGRTRVVPSPASSGAPGDPMSPPCSVPAPACCQFPRSQNPRGLLSKATPGSGTQRFFSGTGLARSHCRIPLFRASPLGAHIPFVAPPPGGNSAK